MQQPPPFPRSRPRRLRRTATLRELAGETDLYRGDLIAPLFVKESIAEPVPISSMPGHYQHTLESLRKEAAELAGLGIPALLLFGVPAGADVIAPSGMMDGQVAAIRAALDGAGFDDTPILAYAAKYASGLYGPFREAAEGAPRFGDRTAYQMDPRNSDEALREVALDVAECADMLMVKPALAYLDVLWRTKREFGLPVAAYHVSGEYAMVKAAAERGWIDGQRVMLEVLTSIRRAGADLVVTYFAREAAPLL